MATRQYDQHIVAWRWYLFTAAGQVARWIKELPFKRKV